MIRRLALILVLLVFLNIAEAALVLGAGGPWISGEVRSSRLVELPSNLRVKWYQWLQNIKEFLQEEGNYLSAFEQTDEHFFKY